MGLAVGLDGRVKSPPPLPFELRNVQAISSYYTVFAIPAACVRRSYVLKIVCYFFSLFLVKMHVASNFMWSLKVVNIS